MPLVFKYSDPRGISEPAVLTDLGQEVVRFGTFAVMQSAEIGEAATSSIDIDDPTGVLIFGGYRAFQAIETSAPSNNQLIASSVILDRHVSRGPFITGAGRRWRLDLADANWIMGLTVQVMADANRPAETAGDRLRWLLGAGRFYLHDDGNVVYPTNAMDACDYRGQNGKDVIADIALACGYNYWASVNEGEGHTELYFFDPNAYLYVSALQISNDPADVDGTTTFYPTRDADMGRSPTRIAYGIFLPYANGSVYVRNDQVGQQYHYIDQVAPMANVKTRAKALAIANRMLGEADEEDDRINCAIKVPAASVNTLRHGHALRVKFLHLPGWEDWRWARVLRRSVLQEEAEGEAAYRLDLELTPITAAAPDAMVWEFYARSSGSLWIFSATEGGVSASPTTILYSGTAYRVEVDWLTIAANPRDHTSSYSQTYAASCGSAAESVYGSSKLWGRQQAAVTHADFTHANMDRTGSLACNSDFRWYVQSTFYVGRNEGTLLRIRLYVTAGTTDPRL